MELAAKDSFTASFDLFIKKATITVRGGDGNANNILTAKNKKMFEVIPRYLSELVIGIGKDSKIDESKVLDLWVVDQEWTLVENYKAQYGDMIELEKVPCPKCGKPNNFIQDINELEIIQLPPELRDNEDPTVTIKLPRAGVSAVVGMLTGHQEQLLLKQQAAGKFDLNQSDFQCLRELDGTKDFYYEDVVKLQLQDHYVIRKARKQLVCGYNTIIDMDCEHCGNFWQTNFLSQRDFLVPGG
jgi:hypothetical protein